MIEQPKLMAEFMFSPDRKAQSGAFFSEDVQDHDIVLEEATLVERGSFVDNGVSELCVQNCYVSELTLPSMEFSCSSMGTDCFESFHEGEVQHQSISMRAGQELAVNDCGVDEETVPRQPQRQATLNDGSSHSKAERRGSGSRNLNRRLIFRTEYGCNDRQQSRRTIWLSHKQGLSAITEDSETPTDEFDRSLRIRSNSFCDASSVTMSECMRINRRSSPRPHCHDNTISKETRNSLTAPRQPHRQRSSKELLTSETKKKVMAAPQQPHRQISSKKMLTSETIRLISAPRQPHRQTSCKNMITNGVMTAPQQPHRQISQRNC